MTAARIEHFDADVSNDALIQTLERDGCAIVEGALPPEQLAGMNADLESLIEATPPGTPTALEFIQDFYGFETVRIDGLPGKSKTYLEVVQNPRLLALADHFLQPHCVHDLLNTAQLIQIGPGETAQDLHCDDHAFIHHPKHAAEPGTQPQIEVEAIYALSDFTRENGAKPRTPDAVGLVHG